MSRIQLALNVSDLEGAIDFYSKLFGAEPAKQPPGYANFAINSPPLKLVLIENPGAGGTLNHLGVEVGSSADVTAAQARLAGEGLDTATEDGVSCCYAVQDKVWVSDPDNAPWEIYTVLSDADVFSPPTAASPEKVCCGSNPSDVLSPSTAGASQSGCCGPTN
ncbi:MAG: ArsI/CadI family heavy metal resistance metalloenzyme [Acidimicrobiia bacterium]